MLSLPFCERTLDGQAAKQTQHAAGAIEWIHLEGLEVELIVQSVMEIVGRRVEADVVQVKTTSEDVTLREH